MRSIIALALALTSIGACVRPTGSAVLGAPGSLIASTSIPGPSGGRAWRIRYVSTGLDGKPIEVTGAVVAPSGAATKDRPVVAWAHGATGVGTQCAPSLRGPLFERIDGLAGMLQRGYVVAATDYPGLGTPGPHPLLVGVSEGRAVLDSVRAARKLAEVRAGSRFVAWGTSQGGHASLFTGQLAKRYAPELSLAGVAVSAPATDLDATIVHHVENDSGRVLAAMLLWSWSRVYGAPLEPVLSAASIRKVNLISTVCFQKKLDLPVAGLANVLLGKKFVDARVAGHGTWGALLAQNTVPSTSPGVPLFIAQGTADELVLPRITAAFAERLCSAGASVRFERLGGVDHIAVGPASAPQFLTWVDDRFAGRSAPSDCAARPWL